MYHNTISTFSGQATMPLHHAISAAAHAPGFISALLNQSHDSSFYQSGPAREGLHAPLRVGPTSPVEVLNNTSASTYVYISQANSATAFSLSPLL